MLQPCFGKETNFQSKLLKKLEMAKGNQEAEELFHVPIYTEKYQIKLGAFSMPPN